MRYAEKEAFIFPLFVRFTNSVQNIHEDWKYGCQGTVTACYNLVFSQYHHGNAQTPLTIKEKNGITML
jgi:hypothetical protein